MNKAEYKALYQNATVLQTWPDGTRTIRVEARWNLNPKDARALAEVLLDFAGKDNNG